MSLLQHESKPTRLLLLNLTDGVVEFQAMEYQSIPQLHTQVLPGTKVHSTCMHASLFSYNHMP